MKQSSKKALITLSIVLGIIIIGASVFYGTYYFFINKSNSSYIGVVKEEVAKIKTANENSSAFTKGQTIDTNVITKYLPESIASLQSSKSTLNSLVVTDKYSSDHNNLLLGLENNILMYKEILSIVRDTESPTLDSSLVELQQKRDSCMNYYSLVSIKGIKISLPKESINFLNNSIAYTQKQIRQNADAQIVSSQNRDFMLSFNDTLNDFTQIKKNYMSSIVEARKNVNGYEYILKELSNTENTLNEIKTALSELAIPKDATPVYEAFTNIVSEYDEYLQSLKYAVRTEQITSVPGSSFSNKDALDKLYESPNEQIKTIENNYRSFSKLYSEFEDKTI